MDTTTATATTQVSRTGNLFANRNFLFVWAGQIISSAGDYIFDTTLILWITTVIVRGQAWAPLAVGGVLLAAALPVFVVGPLAGVFVDRWNKRLTMIRMDIVRALLILTLLLATGIWYAPFAATAHLSPFWLLAILYIVVFFTSACAQFFNPSLLALLKEVVDEQNLARATGLAQFSGNLMMVIGPSLATLLFFSIGAQWLFLLNALSFLVSFLTMLAVRVASAPAAEHAGPQGTFMQQFSEGIRFYIRNRVLTTILITGVFGMLYIGASNALVIFFVIRNLHASAELYGFMATTFGVGLTVGAIVASMFAMRVGLVRMFWISLVAGGVLVLIFARLTGFVPAIVVYFLIGCAIATVDVTITPILLHEIPQELVGRIVSIQAPILALASTLSAVAAGFFSSILYGFHATLFGFTFGAIDTIFTITGIFLVAGGFYALRNLHGKTYGEGQEG